MAEIMNERARGAVKRDVDGNGMFGWEWDVLVQCVGEENALKVIAAFEGTRVYFPQKIAMQKRKLAVYKMYDAGQSVAYIANAVGWSESYIRNIVRARKSMKKK